MFFIYFARSLAIRDRAAPATLYVSGLGGRGLAAVVWRRERLCARLMVPPY